MTNYRDISNEEWQRVAGLLPELRPRRDMRGRPLANTREVLNGVLWVICSGGVWSAMPRRYPSYQTCNRRFLAWSESGVLTRLLHELYGAAAKELCETMQVRMRKRAKSPRKTGRVASSLQLMNSFVSTVS
ncbi:transposase [Paraburkholderia antibiotica]|uniref:Transposase n=1 Tax=Paraburkholderia antibiotica TaxID=2728839 RepID=A0A7Y0A2D4_9BURK|nr:transposase [Paraburkholderia antibiotica]NML35247.1 transposase [Paraburkholderia antibiotica]